jgi:hypothetical protein
LHDTARKRAKTGWALGQGPAFHGHFAISARFGELSDTKRVTGLEHAFAGIVGCGSCK